MRPFLLGTGLPFPRLLISGSGGHPAKFRKTGTAKRLRLGGCSSWLKIHIDIFVASFVILLHSVLTRRREKKVYPGRDPL